MTARIHRLKTGKMEPVSVYIQIRTGTEGRILEKIFLLVFLLSGAFMLWIHCFLETTFLSLFNFFHLLGRRCTLEVAKPTSLLCCVPPMDQTELIQTGQMHYYFCKWLHTKDAFF